MVSAIFVFNKWYDTYRDTYRVSDQCIDDTYRIIDTIHKTTYVGWINMNISSSELFSDIKQ